MRRAQQTDLEVLVRLMAEFYEEAGSPMDGIRAAGAFGHLLADPRLGAAWILASDGADAGYMVVTLGYSLEYGGLDAFVDDLFVRRPHRGRGLGRAAVEAARQYCEDRGVRALHLEVARSNDVARRLYRSAGFESNDRELLTRRLDGGTVTPPEPRPPPR